MVDESPDTTGRTTPNIADVLSKSQLRTLKTAHEMGYFRSPRKSSATEVAEELEIAQPTFSERVRDAEHSLLDHIVSE